MNIVKFNKDISAHLSVLLQTGSTETKAQVQHDLLYMLKNIAETNFTKIIAVEDFEAYEKHLNTRSVFQPIHTFTQYWLNHHYATDMDYNRLVEGVVSANWDLKALDAVDTTPDFIGKRLTGKSRHVLTAAILYPISFNLISLLKGK